MMPSQFNNILLAKLQTLLGERGAKQESAVRFRDLADVYDTAATRSTVIVLQKIEPISQAVTENAATIASNQTAAQVVENALAQTQADLVQAVADIDANAAELVSAQLQLNTFQASAEADINAAQSEIITAQANIAQVQENIAAAEASIAAAEASIASTEASIVTLKDIARGGLNGWLKDPIFAEWTGSNLTAANWAGTTGVTAYGSKFSGLYGSGLAINVPSGSASITISASNTSGLVNADPDAPWLVLSFAVEFVSGEPLGLRLRAEWSNDGVTWTRGAMLGATNPLGTLVEHGVTVKAGVVQVKEVLVKRPAGTFAYVRVLFIPKVNSTSTAQVQNWHVLNLRAATEAEIRAGNVPTMQSDITTIQATATTLAGSVATLSTTLSSTTTTANNAASAAGAAQTSADNVAANLSTNYLTATQTDSAIASAKTELNATISTNANTAASAAQAASDLAGGKGKVLYQTSAPAVADRLAQNLWIDTTGGANTPKRWNGSAWVAVTDKIATDAAAAAAAAQSTANTVSANLSTNYLTATQTNTAIASAKTELNATIAGNATTAAAATSAEAITRANEDSAISAYLLNVESAFSTANGVLASQFLDTIIPRWNSGGSMTSTANEVHKIGLTRTFVTTDVQSDGLNLNSTQSTIWLGEKDAAAYVVEVDFTLVSGTLDGSGFLTRWVNTTPTTYGVASKLSDCLTSPLVLGQVMKARALIKKPTGFTGTFSKNEAFLMANWSGFGVPATAKTIKFHRWLVRPATAEEIATGVIQSDLATLSANVSNNIYTKSATDAAIASQTNIVQANVDSLAASVQGYQVPLTAVNKVTAGAAVTVTLDAAALGQTGTIKVVEGSTARVTTGATNGASILVPARTALLFAGQRVKISILAKKPSSGGASNFSIAYASADGNSGVLAMEAGTSLSTTWAWFSFYYTVPAVAAGGDSYIGLFGDNSKTSKATIFARAMIDVAAVSGDLPEIATLTASSTAYSAAIAQLNGNAAATQSFRVVAGSAGASVELVASDNPVSGPASSAIISGKHIELKASSVRISNASNIYLDYDLIDDDFYSSPDSAVLTFLPTTSAALGKRYMNIAANAAIKTINSGWVPVEYGATYKVSAAGWIASAAAGAGTVKVFLELGDVNTSGAATATSRILICSTTDLNFSLALFGSIEFATSGTTRAVRFVVERQAGGTASARAGAFKIEKKSDSTLIVDGAVYTQHLASGSITADKMDVAWLNAGRLSASYLDVDGLLTIGVGAGMKYQKSSVSDDATDGVYLGVESASGSPRFGFAASRTSPLGKKQSLKLTSNEGLQLVNARHFVTGSSAPTPAFVGSSQTVTLPVGSKYLNLEVYGGGGGGKGGADTTTAYANGGNGGTTLVKLFNGTTDTGISWSGAGGAGGSLTTSSDSGQYGQASPFGSGGIGYRRASGGNASGNAAGGAGGGDYYASGYGGAAAVPNTQNLIDISGYANPKLVITVGAGGAGGPNGGGGGTGAIGGNGSPGCVNYSVSLQSLTPADVIPLTATASGLIYKTGLSITFPNLGAGLWFLSSEDGTSNLDIGWIGVGGPDGRHILQDKSAVFISAFTPIRAGGGFSANRTIRYHFYSMGNWG